MNRQYCQSTGRMFHSFDKATHRCKCGRWQRGFKPAKVVESAKPRAECQICGREQAVDANGRLGHHGYTRPGYGFIQGDCFGVHYAPYPATDALQKYAGALQNSIDCSEDRLAELPTVASYDYKDRKGNLIAVVKRGDERVFSIWAKDCRPSFAHLEEIAKADIESSISLHKSELRRVEERIAAAN